MGLTDGQSQVSSVNLMEQAAEFQHLEMGWATALGEAVASTALLLHASSASPCVLHYWQCILI